MLHLIPSQKHQKQTQPLPKGDPGVQRETVVGRFFIKVFFFLLLDLHGELAGTALAPEPQCTFTPDGLPELLVTVGAVWPGGKLVGARSQAKTSSSVQEKSSHSFTCLMQSNYVHPGHSIFSGTGWNFRGNQKANLPPYQPQQIAGHPYCN